MSEPAVNLPSLGGVTPSAPLMRGRKHSFRAVLLAVLVAVLGAVIGSGLTVIYFNRHRPKPAESDYTERLASRISVKITSEFNLDDAATKKIREIVTSHMREVKRIRQTSRDNISNELEAMREEIGAVLGPEKAEQWNKEVENQVGRLMSKRKRDMPGGHQGNMGMGRRQAQQKEKDESAKHEEEAPAKKVN